MADEEQIARERIEILFEEAEEAFEDHPERSDRYVELARTIAMTYTLSLSREQRMRFCSACGSYLVPGENARLRVDEGEKSIVCGGCGNVDRYPYRD